MTASAQSEKGHASRLKRIATWGVAALITLIMLESVLRVVGVARPVLYERDAVLGLRLKPSQDVRYFGNRIVINTWGVRDPRSLEARSNSKSRIVVLGDSVTWGGVRIRQEDLFTARLEAALSRSEIVNAGVNGYSVARMAGLYRSYLTGLQSDGVLVYAIAADFTRPIRLELVDESPAFPLEPPKLALAVAFDLARLLVAYQTGWAWLRPSDGARPADGELSPPERLRQNVTALEAWPGPLLVVLAPTMADAAQGDVFAPIVAALDQRGIRWIRLDSLITLDPADYLDGVHLSARGHQRVGQALAAPVAEWIGLGTGTSTDTSTPATEGSAS